MKTRTLQGITLALAVVFALTLSAGAVEVISVSLTPAAEEDINYAPIAENLSITTFRSVSVSGHFSAVDPEGDAITFSVARQPEKGIVSCDGTSFVYTPADGSKGRDSFTYIATDSLGNSSGEATVSVRIEKQSVKLSYADMDGSGAQYASLRLAEAGIYTGRRVGGVYYFDPSQPVSRAEFLSMCLSAAGIDTLDGITKTGFSDDADIPSWDKAAVSTALLAGIIQGYAVGDGEIIFSPAADITAAEAMVMLNNALRISDVSASLTISDDALPVWAAQAASNLSACSIVNGSLSYPDSVTRAEAAEMLCSALELIDARGGSSLLSWAK